MEIMKVYLPVIRGFVTTSDGNEESCTHIQCSIDYDLGGISMFTGQKHGRGYYLHVKPVTIERSIVRFMMFSGAKFLLVKCGRRSKNKELMARAMFEKTVRSAVEQLYGKEGVDFSPLPISPDERSRTCP